MKTINFLIITASTALILSACSAKKPVSVQKENGAQKLSLPFSSKEFQSDKETFRENKSGNSPDMSFAEDIALSSAKAQMASNIQTKIKKSLDIYKKGYNSGGGKDFESKQEGWQREITELSMSNIKIIGKELFKETDGSYTFYIAIEADKKEIFESLLSKVSSESKSRVDFDEKKYKEDIAKEFSDYQKPN
jgi:uncharacterized protein YukE